MDRCRRKSKRVNSHGVPRLIEENLSVYRLAYLSVLGAHIIRPCHLTRHCKVESILRDIARIAVALKLSVMHEHPWLHGSKLQPPEMLIDFVELDRPRMI